MKNSLIKTFGSDYKNHLEIISVKTQLQKNVQRFNSINSSYPTPMSVFIDTTFSLLSNVPVLNRNH